MNENLVGPRSDERQNESLEEEVSATGEPLWMAFLEDSNALNISADEVHVAKNAYETAKQQHPEVMQMCAHKSIDECKTILKSMHSESEAAA